MAKRRKSPESDVDAPNGFAKNGQPRKVPIATPKSKKTKIVKLPVKTKSAKTKITKKSSSPAAAAGEELDQKTYFKLWSIKEHLEYHALALRAEDRDIVKDYGLDAIAKRLERAIKALKKVVPKPPTGDDPLSSPAQI